MNRLYIINNKTFITINVFKNQIVTITESDVDVFIYHIS